MKKIKKIVYNKKITGLRDSASRELLMKVVHNNKLETKGKNRGRYYVGKLE